MQNFIPQSRRFAREISKDLSRLSVRIQYPKQFIVPAGTNSIAGGNAHGSWINVIVFSRCRREIEFDPFRVEALFGCPYPVALAPAIKFVPFGDCPC
jgi:hypothetical protein